MAILQQGVRPERCIVLGVGNSLRADDGLGVHVVEHMRETYADRENSPQFLDAGTLGLSLLPMIEDADALIIVDAANLNAAPGEVAVFEDADMMAHLSKSKSSVHEVSMSDLLDAAALLGVGPKHRALVAVQPDAIGWAESPTQIGSEAIPHACAMVEDILRRWTQ